MYSCSFVRGSPALVLVAYTIVTNELLNQSQNASVSAMLAVNVTPEGARDISSSSLDIVCAIA